MVTSNPWQHRTLCVTSWLAGFGIPVSVATENIAAGCMLLAFLAMPALWSKLAEVCRRPLIVACLALYTILLLAATYSPSLGDAGRMLVKMRAYLCAPILFIVLLDPSARKALLSGFAIGVALSVILSLGAALTQTPILLAEPDRHNWQIFHTHVYHNYYVSLLICGLLVLWIANRLPVHWRIPAAVIVVLGSIDILFFVTGRTGQLLFLLLLGLLLVLWRWRVGLLLALAGAVVLIPILIHSSAAVRNSVSQTRQELSRYQQGDNGRADSDPNSLGIRFEMYQNTWTLITQKPWLGHGTGSLPVVYQQLVASNPKAIRTSNPHNDYLWVMCETGVLGLLALIGILLATAWQGWRGSLFQRHAALCLSLSMAVATLANSFFTDNITGLGFVLLACAILAGDEPFSRAETSM